MQSKHSFLRATATLSASYTPFTRWSKHEANVEHTSRRVYIEYVCFMFASSCKRGTSYLRGVCLSVCLSVCLFACLSVSASVTTCSPIKTVQARITKSSLWAATRTLVFLWQNFVMVGEGIPLKRKHRSRVLPKSYYFTAIDSFSVKALPKLRNFLPQSSFCFLVINRPISDSDQSNSVYNEIAHQCCSWWIGTVCIPYAFFG